MAVASAGLYASLHPMQTTTPTSHHSVFYRPDALPAKRNKIKIVNLNGILTGKVTYLEYSIKTENAAKIKQTKLYSKQKVAG